MALVIADNIKETSTTTGTGAMTMAGAVTGSRAFSAKCTVGDTAYYGICAVDAGGVPTGGWECGLGTYSSANTLTRTTVTSSSNADAAVAFSAGTKHVYITMPAAQVKWPRERLTANRTYYVRSDGNDSNSGLANTTGGAFLLIQKAVDVISMTLDIGPYQVDIQANTGTFYNVVNLKPYVGTVAPRIIGSPSTIWNTTGSCIDSVPHAGYWKIQNFHLAPDSGHAIRADVGVYIEASIIQFDGCPNGYQMFADGGTIKMQSTTATLAGAAKAHCYATRGGKISFNVSTLTMAAAYNFSEAFIKAELGGLVQAITSTYSGSAQTGIKYVIKSNGIVDTLARATPYTPGSIAGTTETGGQYV